MDSIDRLVSGRATLGRPELAKFCNSTSPNTALSSWVLNTEPACLSNEPTVPSPASPANRSTWACNISGAALATLDATDCASPPAADANPACAESTAPSASAPRPVTLLNTDDTALLAVSKAPSAVAPASVSGAGSAAVLRVSARSDTIFLPPVWVADLRAVPVKRAAISPACAPNTLVAPIRASSTAIGVAPSSIIDLEKSVFSVAASVN